MDRRQAKNALESDATLAAVLNSLMMRQFGEDWLDWDLVTVYYELRDTFDCEPSSETMDRLGALQVLQTTSEFFDRLDAFLGIVNSLNTGRPSFAIFNPVSAAEASWAVVETSLIRDLLPFNYSIRKYAGQAMRSEGLSGDMEGLEALSHIVTAKDPSSNEVKDIYAEYAGLAANLKAGSDYMDDQLKMMAAQFHSLGLDGELSRLLNQKDMDDALSA